MLIPGIVTFSMLDWQDVDVQTRVVPGRYRRSRTAFELKQDRDPTPQFDVSYSMWYSRLGS